MAKVNFLMGELSNLGAAPIKAGNIYVITDEQSMYVDIAEGKRVRIGDVTEVADVASLPDPAVVSTSALYFAVAEKALCKSNGTAWNQVNEKLTTAELKTMLGWDANNNALKKYADDAVAVVKTELETKIGELETASGDFVQKNADITPGTGTKVTYDAKGLVTGSTTLDKEDIPTIEQAQVNGLGEALNGKADKATTLAGYGITNAYTKQNSDTLYPVTITASDEGGGNKKYSFVQNGVEIGSIDMAADNVVTSGTVEVDPAGQPAGTYIVLTLATEASEKIYINVASLVDLTTSNSNPDDIVQIAVTSTNGVSASIKANSITLNELAADVTDILAKASSALQKEDITSGVTNGTLSIKGTEVGVAGLKGAAFQPTTAFESAGTVDAAKTELTASIADALAEAKKYADDAVTEGPEWGSF